MKITFSCLFFLFAVSAAQVLHIPVEKHVRQVSTSKSNLETGRNEPLNANKLSYVGKIFIGTPPQKFLVEFDTQGADVSIPSKNCSNCGTRRKYDHDKSSTYEQLKLRYTTFCEDDTKATPHGFNSLDTVTVGGISSVQQVIAENEFICKSTYSPYDGRLGLGWAELGSYYFPFIQNLYFQRQITDPTFAIYLSKKDGEISIGGYNSKRFTGKITYGYLPIRAAWEVDVQSILIDTKTIQNITGPFVTFLDSKYPSLYGPRAVIRKINLAIGGTHLPNDSYALNCKHLKKYPNVSFTVNGTRLTLTPEDYVDTEDGKCLSNFIAGPEEETSFTLGIPFLRAYYTIYDFFRGRIGFAKAVH